MAHRTCLAVEGVALCGRPHYAKDYCSKHYQRWKRYGDPTQTAAHSWPENLLQRMAPQPDGCILYTGGLDDGGYGQIVQNRKNRRAHRAAYEYFVGPIPPGMTIDHECHNRVGCELTDASCPHRRCVNPDHLVPKPIGANSAASPNSNAAKTHCPKGHPYDEENTYWYRGTYRGCRTCRRSATQEWRERTRQ